MAMARKGENGKLNGTVTGNGQSLPKPCFVGVARRPERMVSRQEHIDMNRLNGVPGDVAQYDTSCPGGSFPDGYDGPGDSGR